MLRNLVWALVVCAMSVGCGKEESSSAPAVAPAPAAETASVAAKSPEQPVAPKKVNRPPVIVSTDASSYHVKAGGKEMVYYVPGNETGKRNVRLSGLVHARDPDGDELKYSTFGAPDGLQFGWMDGFPGSWSWEPRSDQAGTYDVTIVVSDGVLEAKTAIKIVAEPIRPPVINPQTPRELRVKSGYVITSSVEAHDPVCPWAPLQYRVVRAPAGFKLQPEGLARNVYSFSSRAAGRFEAEFEVVNIDDVIATHKVVIVVE